MPTPRFEIDADIRRAQTLPAWVYADPGVYAQVRERVFARSWQFIGDTDAVKSPGQVHALTLLDGCLGEPILLTRDLDDRVHCLSNVCTHRGTVLVDPGRVASAVGGSSERDRHIRCCYHGRRFALDGTFLSMPEFEQAEGFPSEKDNLPRIPFGAWGHLLFASIAPPFPLDDLLREARARLSWLPIEQFRFDPARSKDYLVRANWALYVDNYLEGFHIPFVHASLAQALDYGEYACETYRHANLQLGIARPGEACFDLPASSPDHGRRVAAYYYWLFPNTMLNFYPWGLSVNVVRPLGVDLTKVSFLSYVWDASRLDSGAGAGLDRVEREDETVVESVQLGVRSRLYERGRYSPTREQCVHHFHALLARALHD